MVFQFPDLETLRLAVTSAQVPPDISAAPAEVAFDAQGRPSIRSAAGIPPRAMQNALRKLGVKQAKDHYSEATFTVECWPQVLPVSKVETQPEVTSNTPVLFEMPAADLPTVVSEMLRLGNDRQSFRTLAPANGRGERVLLKVIGPPYYTLLRAIDKTTHKGADVVAFVEKAPRVWVELGHDHPLAAKIKPSDGQVLLLRPERDWRAIEDEPFQDVYDILDFQLPAATVEWQESQLKGKLSVPLRLVPGNAADVAELWVLTEQAVDQLDALVRDADERLMSRLSFAVARENGETTIVLKTRPSKLVAPVLPLAKAQGFKPFWKLPNLFLPVGKRLMPTLRRDAVRKLLADDPAQVVWLMPGPDGKFTPEVLPDDAFRPLEDWIDYVIDHEHEPLQAWVQATQFDFDSFICREDQPDRPKTSPGEKGKRPGKGDVADEGAESPAPAPTAERKKPPPAEETDFVAQAEAVPPSELKVKRAELEERFKAVEGPIDSPERLALWPELAQLNAALKDTAEASICWTNAFWEQPRVPVDGAWQWLRTEDPNARKTPTAVDVDQALANKMPSPNDVRSFAARVIHAFLQSPVPDFLRKRLPKIREFLEKYEEVLGVRPVWLTWSFLARADGDHVDVLALARVRDRLLNRLLTQGLNKERDLPYFLRTAGSQDSQRMRLVRERAVRVHKLIDDWHLKEKKGPQDRLEYRPPYEVNKPYVDLLFAFGFARLGDITIARDLVRAASNRLLEPKPAKGKPEPAHAFLLKAFEWRIENAIQGKSHIGPLPADLMAALDKIDEGRGPEGVDAQYVVNRMRHESWVLEPQEKQDPYADKQRAGGGLYQAIAELAGIRDKRQLADAIRKLDKNTRAPDGRMMVFSNGLGYAARLGEEFTLSLIERVPAILDESLSTSGPGEYTAKLGELQHKLFERALFLAAHYDRTELVQSLFGHFLTYLRSRKGNELYDAVSAVARECLRSLRKLGMKNEIDHFLQQVKDLIVRDRSLPQLRQDAGRHWPELLMSLLALAEGWQFFGGYEQAKPILDECRSTIFENADAPKDRVIVPQRLTKLVQAYVSALCQGSLEEALFRMEELFPNLERLPNTFTTGLYYSLLHLKIVEEVVRSLVSDNVVLGDQARRWLDDDEYLVRRRIHGDMKKLLAQSGL